MDIIISNADPRPIYEQIYAQIRDMIVSGKLCEGDSLPSIRALAKDLRISVITTKRAYDELEHDGFINTVASKGCYVARMDAGLMREQALREIEELMRQIAAIAARLPLSEEEISAMYKTVTAEENEE